MARRAAQCRAALLAALLLASALPRLRAQTCDVQGGADVCIAMDSSGSIATEGYEQEKAFTLQLVDNFDESSVRIAIFAFATSPRLVASLNTSYAEKRTLVEDHTRTRGGTGIVRILEACSDLLLATNRRSQKLVILMTDGEGVSSPERQVEEADNLKNSSITLATVGISLITASGSFDGDVLREMASQKRDSSDPLFYSFSIDRLPEEAVAKEVVQEVCQVIDTGDDGLSSGAKGGIAVAGLGAVVAVSLLVWKTGASTAVARAIADVTRFNPGAPDKSPFFHPPAPDPVSAPGSLPAGVAVAVGGAIAASGPASALPQSTPAGHAPNPATDAAGHGPGAPGTTIDAAFTAGSTTAAAGSASQAIHAAWSVGNPAAGDVIPGNPSVANGPSNGPVGTVSGSGAPGGIPPIKPGAGNPGGTQPVCNVERTPVDVLVNNPAPVVCDGGRESGPRKNGEQEEKRSTLHEVEIPQEPIGASVHIAIAIDTCNAGCFDHAHHDPSAREKYAKAVSNFLMTLAVPAKGSVTVSLISFAGEEATLLKNDRNVHMMTSLEGVKSAIRSIQPPEGTHDRSTPSAMIRAVNLCNDALKERSPLSRECSLKRALIMSPCGVSDEEMQTARRSFGSSLSAEGGTGPSPIWRTSNGVVLCTVGSAIDRGAAVQVGHVAVICRNIEQFGMRDVMMLLLALIQAQNPRRIRGT